MASDGVGSRTRPGPCPRHRFNVNPGVSGPCYSKNYSLGPAALGAEVPDRGPGLWKKSSPWMRDKKAKPEPRIEKKLYADEIRQQRGDEDYTCIRLRIVTLIHHYFGTYLRSLRIYQYH